VNQNQGGTITLAVGTYTVSMPHVDGKGKGISLLSFDTSSGELSELAVQKATNPSFLTVSADGRRLYAVREVDAKDGPGLCTYALDSNRAGLTLLQDLATPGGWPCHVSVNDACSLALVSNYATGEVLAFSLDANGVPASEPVVLSRKGHGPNLERQEGPHAHCALVSPDRRYVYLADLGVDGVVRHPLEDAVDPASDLTLEAAPGAGPRHLVFSHSGDYLLVNHELSSTVRMYKLGDTVTLVSEVSTLPSDSTVVSAAGGMRLHPSGKFVYVGNRGHDSIFGARVDEANGKLVPIGTWDVGGRTPRDLAVSPDGRFLLAASQDDAFIRVFSIDAQSGELTFGGYDYPIASAVCLQFVNGD
jgi:6-phosphogluconolactonase